MHAKKKKVQSHLCFSQSRLDKQLSADADGFGQRQKSQLKSFKYYIKRKLQADIAV